MPKKRTKDELKRLIQLLKEEKQKSWIRRNYQGVIAIIALIIAVLAFVPQFPSLRFFIYGEPSIKFSIYGCKWVNETKALDDYLKQICFNNLNVGQNMPLQQNLLSQYISSFPAGAKINISIFRVSPDMCTVSASCEYTVGISDVLTVTDTLSVCIDYANGTSTCH